MPGVAVIGGAGGLTERLARELRALPGRRLREDGGREGEAAGGPGGDDVRVLDGPAAEVAEALSCRTPSAAVYLAGERTADGAPDLEDAAACLAACAAAGVGRVAVVASAAVHPASHHHLGLVAEDRVSSRADPGSLAARWMALERIALERIAGETPAPGTPVDGETAPETPRKPQAGEAPGPSGAGRLLLLRPTATPLPGGRDFWSRLFARRLVPVVAGFDPAVQLLAPSDLAAALGRALDLGTSGVYHVAPAAAAPLRAAIRLAGRRPLPLPAWLVRLLVPGARAGGLPYLRWSWTVSGEKIRRELGFAPRYGTAEAAAALGPGAIAPRSPSPAGTSPAASVGEHSPPFDDFGLDPAYVRRWGRTWFRFLHDVYWRVEVRGVENVPRQGRAVLVGMHRGFMPFDGVMAFHHVERERGRLIRFLLHPSLLKFPFLFDLMTKLGGVPACRENGDRVLASDGLLGIFPEGIRGAFTPYREAYRLGNFGRDDFVRLALRNRSPLVPFVTVGSAEIFPIVGRVDWRWLKRWTEWPFFPITWSPPLIPLPSKWHTRYLPPLHVERDHPPEAAEDPEVVAALSAEVRRRMQEAVDGMLARRRRIFRGSIFEGGEE